jgi:hypothetical protein
LSTVQGAASAVWGLLSSHRLYRHALSSHRFFGGPEGAERPRHIYAIHLCLGSGFSLVLPVDDDDDDASDCSGRSVCSGAAGHACKSKEDYATLGVSRPWKSDFHPSFQSSALGGAIKKYALELRCKPLAVFAGHKLPEAPKKAFRTH